MTSYSEVPLQDFSVPIPPAYSRQAPYVCKPDLDMPSRPSRDTFQPDPNDSDQGWPEKEQYEDKLSSGMYGLPVLVILQHSRIFFRALAILIIIASIALVLAAVVIFEKMRSNQKVGELASRDTVTIKPCAVFLGIAAMNLIMSIMLLAVSSLPTKLRRSQNTINFAFAIVGVIGFSTSMGACFYLDKETQLQNDLWKWSCAKAKLDTMNDTVKFHIICKVITFGWNLGIIQASLEMLTFVLSIVAFILYKYHCWYEYGHIGKVI
ncbi:unnamed protein product [Blumeria hordei]|uniref:Uncharacterized protein n=1 Tax=Blumeria hordei TaxID=2867405 RepID=A0A383UWI8_BLUHO|nr:unnamed protein product [Blumeria hordei]